MFTEAFRDMVLDQPPSQGRGFSQSTGLSTVFTLEKFKKVNCEELQAFLPSPASQVRNGHLHF
uniref:Uncharacterized protein n=1 Tax=Anguilla anguilla TaxID=7936 RepID=A0A0E9QFS8_ANGAN